MRFQSKDNKQCRDDNKLEEEKIEKLLIEIEEMQRLSFNHYQNLLDSGLAREVARIDLPVATYSEMYWKIDLHNLFHFLKLRLDKHAQKEIRVYAEAVYKLIEPIVPVACEAFDNYLLNSISLSKDEKNILSSVLCDLEISEKVKETILNSSTISKREKKELIEKLGI
jgi:thymidylate synthase (FAD)